MRRIFPQTLPAWLLVIVIAGLLASQVATLFIVSRDRAASDEIADLYRLNDRAYTLAQLMHAAAPEERQRLAVGLSNANYALTVSSSPVVSSPIAADDQLAELEDIIVSRLSKFGVVEARVRRDPSSSYFPRHGEQPDGNDIGNVERDLLSLASSFSKSDKLTGSIQFADGQWLNFTTPVTPPSPVLSLDSLPMFAVVASLIVAASIWSVRRLTAPYRLLERAVGRIANDLKSDPIPEKGSREYRSAARAVNAMHLQLREYVEDREHLAAALAHDLRTPLTRMRLRMEMLRKNSPVRSALMNDLSDIDAIARSVVDFTTLEVTDEKVESVDIWSLVDAIADAYPEVTFDGARMDRRGMVCDVRPIAIRRCITNLVENAIKYGKKARIHLSKTEDDVFVTIIDAGPGIPPEMLETVFRPFARVEGSRNRQTGGLGLGLTIARNIARAAGGDIVLSNAEGEGLRSQLRLPRRRG